MREMLDLWPEFPITIMNYGGDSILMAERVDNVIDALELNDRVSQINLRNLSSSELEIYLATMQCPFLSLYDEMERRRSFPIRSWADLLHVYNHCGNEFIC